MEHIFVYLSVLADDVTTVWLAPPLAPPDDLGRYMGGIAPPPSIASKHQNQTAALCHPTA